MRFPDELGSLSGSMFASSHSFTKPYTTTYIHTHGPHARLAPLSHGDQANRKHPAWPVNHQHGLPTPSKFVSRSSNALSSQEVMRWSSSKLVMRRSQSSGARSFVVISEHRS